MKIWLGDKTLLEKYYPNHSKSLQYANYIIYQLPLNKSDIVKACFLSYQQYNLLQHMVIVDSNTDSLICICGILHVFFIYLTCDYPDTISISYHDINTATSGIRGGMEESRWCKIFISFTYFVDIGPHTHNLLFIRGTLVDDMTFTQ